MTEERTATPVTAGRSRRELLGKMVVATQFLTHVLINFLKNPKIAKNIENPKNTFLIHLHRF